jgi:hypothetical protein
MGFRERLADEQGESTLRAAEQISHGAEESAQSLRHLADAVWSAAESSDPGVADLVRLDGAVLGLEFGATDWEAHWGQPLIPARMIDGEPFQVTDLPDAVEPFAVLRAGSARHDVSARWNDVRWLRWRTFEAVVPAIDAYLSAAAAADPSDIELTMEVLGGLKRAADLAVRLNQRRGEVCHAVDATIRRWSASGRSMPAMELAKAAGGLLSVDPPLARELAAALITEALSKSGLERDQLLEAAEEVARPAGHRDLVMDARRRRAEALEQSANRRRGIARIVELRQAIDLFGQIGDADALRRVKAAYEEAGREAQSELKVFSSVVTIPREKIEAQVDRLTLGSGPSLEGVYHLPFQLGFWRSWSTVREDRLRSDSEHVMLALAPRVSLEADGRIQPEPDRDEDHADFEHARDVAFFAQQEGARVGGFLTLLPELRHRGVWSAPIINTAIALIDEGLALSCGPGIVRFEANDQWSAGHVLVPQVERALRVLGREVGADQSRFARDEGLKWATLDPLLDDEGIVAATGQWFADAIAALMTDPQGPNIRNNVAHGALATDSEPVVASVLALMAILSTCYFTAISRPRRLSIRARSGEDAPAP